MINKKTRNAIIIIISIVIGSAMLLGFFSIYGKLREGDDMVDIITLFTIPSVIGSLILPTYLKNGKGLLLSSVLLFTGFLLINSNPTNWAEWLITLLGGFGVILLIMGALLLVYNLLNLLAKLYKEGSFF